MTAEAATIAERPTRRSKPTGGAAQIQSAREDAGLTREELARRCLLADHHMRNLNGGRWHSPELRLDDHSIELETKRLQKLERSHLHEPSSTTLSELLTLIDAGPAGTPDEDVLTYWREFVAESVADELDNLREIGENFAVAVHRSADDLEHLGALMVNFFDKTLATVRRRQFTDPRYIHDARDKTLHAALTKLASL